MHYKGRSESHMITDGESESHDHRWGVRVTCITRGGVRSHMITDGESESHALQGEE